MLRRRIRRSCQLVSLYLINIWDSSPIKYRDYRATFPNSNLCCIFEINNISKLYNWWGSLDIVNYVSNRGSVLSVTASRKKTVVHGSTNYLLNASISASCLAKSWVINSYKRETFVNLQGDNYSAIWNKK